jgi:adenylate cyclase
MPNWTWDYINDLWGQLLDIVDDLQERLDEISAPGRVAPALDDLTIGTGRRLRAATLFFDIRGFSKRTTSPNLDALKRSLFMLDCVIPMMMRVLYDHGGYVEKNTGDGIMAIIGAEEDDETAANAALDAATKMFWVLEHVVNLELSARSMEPVQARIGLDLGTLLIARIGMPTGSAKHPRSTLTAVGPSANLACRLQQRAGTNEIWCGDLIKRNARANRQQHFRDTTPTDWTWNYADNPEVVYRIWNYYAVRRDPPGEPG